MLIFAKTFAVTANRREFIQYMFKFVMNLEKKNIFSLQVSLVEFMAWFNPSV